MEEKEIFQILDSLGLSFDEFNSKYDIKYNEKIGSGIYGTVFKGRRKRDKIPVAIKIIKLPEINPSNKQKIISLGAELLLLRRVKISTCSQYFVCQYDYSFEHDENGILLYIAMELMENDLSFDNVSIEELFGVENMLLINILNIYKQCFGGLAELQRHKIVHRDIKPENLLYKHNDKKEIIVKIGDFGLSCLFSDFSKKTIFTCPKDSNAGSLYFSDPTSFVLNNPVNYEGDVYSMCKSFLVTFYAYGDFGSDENPFVELLKEFTIASKISFSGENIKNYLLGLQKTYSIYTIKWLNQYILPYEKQSDLSYLYMAYVFARQIIPIPFFALNDFFQSLYRATASEILLKIFNFEKSNEKESLIKDEYKNLLRDIDNSTQYNDKIEQVVLKKYQ